MDLFKIQVLKWGKFNPRRDVKRPSWFPLSNELVEDDEFFDFSHAEFKVWIYILSKSSQKQSDTIELRVDAAKRKSNLKAKDINSALHKLLKLGHIEFEHVTHTSRGRNADVTDTSRTRHATQHNNTLHNNTLITQNADVTRTSRKKRIPTEPCTSPDGAAPQCVKDLALLSEKKVTKTRSIIATYCDLFKAKYGSTAEINGKQAGMLGALVKSRSLEAATNLLENYFSLPDAYLVQRCHPVEMIHANMNRITVFRDTGRVITKAQAYEVDKNQAWVQDNSEAERKYREELKNVLGKDKKALVGGAQ